MKFFWFAVAAFVGFCSVYAAAWFPEQFDAIWAQDHVKQLPDNNTVQLVLDQNSGAGIKSRSEYMFGLVSVKIKLVPGDSAGTVTAFYLISGTPESRDELDFEFLGNRTGQPYTVQTNIYVGGKGEREQRVNLWFDPSLAYHTYSILWNHNHIIFSVDSVPIRVYRNDKARTVPYPERQSMKIISTLWDADNWATRGGIDKTDWSKAPFEVFYRDFQIHSCQMPDYNNCTVSTRNWWEGLSYSRLSPLQSKLYRWVRLHHMVYDYCADRSRNPVPPPECSGGL